MNFLDSLAVSASGLRAQRLRMNLIASNLANVNTTRMENGEPYRRKDVVFEGASSDFPSILGDEMDAAAQGVKVVGVVDDDAPFIEKFDPGHPDADPNGFVRLPNVNVVEEMVNMISASRSFEANATAVRTTKDMAGTALDIGRSA